MDTMIELPAMRRSAELAPNTADAVGYCTQKGLTAQILERAPGQTGVMLTLAFERIEDAAVDDSIPVFLEWECRRVWQRR